VKRPGFFEGAAVALVASLAGGACYSALTSVFPSAAVFRLVVAALGLAYVVYLLRQSEERVGRVTAIVLWLVAAVALWIFGPPSLLYLCAHLGLVWLVRSLYFHSSLLSALADLGLVALGLAAAVWAARQSGSFALSLWCFFLVQALYAAIPARFPGESGPAGVTVPEDRFQLAHRAAEAALRSLHSIR
jgi:hypothetical protein